MTGIRTLRRLLGTPAQSTKSGVVSQVLPSGVVLVTTSTGVVSCSTMIPVRAGDDVRLQGVVIVAQQRHTGSLPEYRV